MKVLSVSKLFCVFFYTLSARRCMAKTEIGNNEGSLMVKKASASSNKSSQSTTINTHIQPFSNFSSDLFFTTFFPNASFVFLKTASYNKFATRTSMLHAFFPKVNTTILQQIITKSAETNIKKTTSSTTEIFRIQTNQKPPKVDLGKHKDLKTLKSNTNNKLNQKKNCFSKKSFTRPVKLFVIINLLGFHKGSMCISFSSCCALITQPIVVLISEKSQKNYVFFLSSEKLSYSKHIFNCFLLLFQKKSSRRHYSNGFKAHNSIKNASFYVYYLKKLFRRFFFCDPHIIKKISAAFEVEKLFEDLKRNFMRDYEVISKILEFLLYKTPKKLQKNKNYKKFVEYENLTELINDIYGSIKANDPDTQTNKVGKNFRIVIKISGTQKVTNYREILKANHKNSDFNQKKSISLFLLAFVVTKKAGSRNTVHRTQNHQSGCNVRDTNLNRGKQLHINSTRTHKPSINSFFVSFSRVLCKEYIYIDCPSLLNGNIACTDYDNIFIKPKKAFKDYEVLSSKNTKKKNETKIYDLLKFNFFKKRTKAEREKSIHFGRKVKNYNVTTNLWLPFHTLSKVVRKKANKISPKNDYIEIGQKYFKRKLHTDINNRDNITTYGTQDKKFHQQFPTPSTGIKSFSEIFFPSIVSFIKPSFIINNKRLFIIKNLIKIAFRDINYRYKTYDEKSRYNYSLKEPPNDSASVYVTNVTSNNIKNQTFLRINCFALIKQNISAPIFRTALSKFIKIIQTKVPNLKDLCCNKTIDACFHNPKSITVNESNNENNIGTIKTGDAESYRVIITDSKTNLKKTKKSSRIHKRYERSVKKNEQKKVQDSVYEVKLKEGVANNTKVVNVAYISGLKKAYKSKVIQVLRFEFTETASGYYKKILKTKIHSSNSDGKKISFGKNLFQNKTSSQYIFNESNEVDTTKANHENTEKNKANKADNRLDYYFPFRINEKGGVIYTVGLMDRERFGFCKEVMRCKINLDVTIKPPRYFKMIRIIVHIEDVNDNAPTFLKAHDPIEFKTKKTFTSIHTLLSSNSLYNEKQIRVLDGVSIEKIVRVDISETVSVGSIHSLPQAVDADGPSFNIADYGLCFIDKKISKALEDLMEETAYKTNKNCPAPHHDFFLQVNETKLHNFEPFLKVMKPLDRERCDFYMMVLLSYDKGLPPNSAAILLLVSLLDANDNSPVFEFSQYKANVIEHCPTGSTVVTVHATDLDIESNALIKYNFSEQTIKNYGNVFAIDEYSGNVVVVGTIDYELKPIYHLSITARDSGTTSNVVDTSLIINVVDTNDKAPTVRISTLNEKTHNNNLKNNFSFATISENSAVGSFVAHVHALDQDFGPVNCYLVSKEKNTTNTNESKFSTHTHSYKNVNLSSRPSYLSSPFKHQFYPSCIKYSKKKCPDFYSFISLPSKATFSPFALSLRSQTPSISQYQLVSTAVLDREVCSAYKVSIRFQFLKYISVIFSFMLLIRHFL